MRKCYNRRNIRAETEATNAIYELETSNWLLLSSPALPRPAVAPHAHRWCHALGGPPGRTYARDLPLCGGRGAVGRAHDDDENAEAVGAIIVLFSFVWGLGGRKLSERPVGGDPKTQIPRKLKTDLPKKCITIERPKNQQQNHTGGGSNTA